MTKSRAALISALLCCACTRSPESSATPPTPAPDAGLVGAPGGLLFEETAKRAGIAVERGFPKTFFGRFAGGVCVFDADGDGRLDLFFPFPSSVDGGGARLYLSRGAMTFVDETAARGLAAPSEAGACVAVDIDGDGDRDLVVSGPGTLRLFRNDAGHFVDASDRIKKSVPPDVLVAGVVAFDADGDGDLDLAIATYGRFVMPEKPEKCVVECPMNPTNYRGGTPWLLLQNDDGTFDDASARLGSFDEPGLVVLATDLDDDGKLDLYVGNDLGIHHDRYFRGDGKGGFVDVAEAMGVAFNASKSGMSTMNASDGDLDGDGKLDMVTSGWADETSAIFRCSDGKCVDVGEKLELFRIPRNLRWGQVLADLDDDRSPELMEALGNFFEPTDFGVPAKLLPLPVVESIALWSRRSLDATTPFALQMLSPKTAGRGMIAADLDGDGDLDIVIATAKGPALVLRNHRPPTARALDLRLRGKGKNVDAIGARVVAHVAGARFASMVHAGSGYLSSDDGRVHVGLGDRTAADRVEIRWPSGKTSIHENVAAGAKTIDEP